MILDFFFITTFILFPVFIMTILCKSTNFSLLRYSVFIISMASLFIFSYAGLLPLYFKMDPYRVALGVTDKNQILFLFTCSIVAITSISLTFLSLNLVSPIKKNFYTLAPKAENLSVDLNLLIIIIISIFVLIIYLIKIPELAILKLITDGIESAKIARSNMTANFPGKYHWYKVVLLDSLQLIAYIFFAKFLNAKTLYNLMMFIFVTLIAIFCCIMATMKAPVAYFTAGLFLTYCLSLKSGKYPLKQMMALGIVSLMLLFLAFFNTMRTKGIKQISYSIMSRTLTGQITPAYFYVEYFPKEEDFLLGTSAPSPKGILPHKPFSIANKVMSWKFPHLEEKGITGSAPTVFWGEGFANFHFFGVIIFSILIGAILFIVEASLARASKTPSTIALAVWLGLHYKDIATTSLTTFVIDFYLIFILCVWAFISKLPTLKLLVRARKVCDSKVRVT